MSEARIEASDLQNPIDLATIARHVGDGEVPWVRNPLTDAEMRLLQVRLEDKMWVLHGRMPAGMTAARHRHTGPVLGFTMNGAWRYLEHDFVNRAGSYLYEPAGSEHTLAVDPDDATEALFVMYGEVLYLDPDDEVTYVSNAQTNLKLYYDACEEAGLARPDAILR